MLLEGSPITSLEDYRDAGGLSGMEAAARLGPDAVAEELVASGLRGRGGAGFPTGTKWRSVMAGGRAAGQRFVVANAAEGEPGSFKDRTIIRHNPFALVEGLLIAAWTLGADRAIVGLKASFAVEAELIAAAAGEMASARIAEGISVEIARGPDEYLFGEEKALLEVIEGEDPLPRLFPPYVYGLFTTEPQLGWSSGSTLESGRSGSNPTLVNNVETLSSVPQILARGADWYRSMGTDESPGTIVCTISGDTTIEGVAEYEMGTPLSRVIEEVGGGLPDGRAVKYVLSGVANPVIRADHLDTPLTYEHMEAIGSGLGTGGFIVFDDRTDPVELAGAASRFLWVESCGQCPACKLGTERITEILSGAGPSGGGSFAELSARLENVTDGARCFLPTQEQRLVHSLMADMRVPELRREERGLLVSKVVDLDGDRFRLDERQVRKRPDWTYAPD
ncbi:MAG: NADH-ubiquinone oxidoreductase-F iron-sulfur binding region domain-containing protein [Microthrixaceae bacterium]